MENTLNLNKKPINGKKENKTNKSLILSLTFVVIIIILTSVFGLILILQKSRYEKESSDSGNTDGQGNLTTTTTINNQAGNNVQDNNLTYKTPCSGKTIEYTNSDGEKINILASFESINDYCRLMKVSSVWISLGNIIPDDDVLFTYDFGENYTVSDDSSPITFYSNYFYLTTNTQIIKVDNQGSTVETVLDIDNNGTITGSYRNADKLYYGLSQRTNDTQILKIKSIDLDNKSEIEILDLSGNEFFEAGPSSIIPLNINKQENSLLFYVQVWDADWLIKRFYTYDFTTEKSSFLFTETVEFDYNLIYSQE